MPTACPPPGPSAARSRCCALGLDWFTATDHSYCINSSSEYAAIVGECAAITDGSFPCFPDTELSSEQVGSQIVGDSADLLGLLGPSSNHMGVHGITSRKPGATPCPTDPSWCWR